MEEKLEYSIIDKVALETKNVCSNCTKLLNVCPIYCVQQADTVDKICGRCVHVIHNVDKGNKWRQLAYEILAQHLTYPCSNKKSGCKSILNWVEVLDHEIVCTFQSTICPLSVADMFPQQICNWSGNVKKLDEHIESCHKDLMVSLPQFDWRQPPTNNTIFFTYVGTQIITVVIKYEKDSQYYCLLMLNGNDIDSQCFRYQLELFDESKENSLILRKSRLEPLACMQDNLKNPDRMLEINIKRVKEMLKNTEAISGRFGIVKKNKKEILQITGVTKEEPVNGIIPVVTKDKIFPPDEKMLLELECPVCNEFMIPPIYICQTGHSICSECQSKVTTCPNCRCQFSGARNFTLEKLTTKVHYPCRNREIGCSFVTTSEKIKGHETVCELSETPCILRCGHKCLRPAMYNHLLDTHKNSLLDATKVHIRDLSDKKESFHILYVSGELFRFSVRGSGFNPYKFNVQHLGMVEGEPKFRYQLSVVDPLNYGQSLDFTLICQCLTEIPNKAHGTAVTVPGIYSNRLFLILNTLTTRLPLLKCKQQFCYW